MVHASSVNSQSFGDPRFNLEDVDVWADEPLIVRSNMTVKGCRILLPKGSSHSALQTEDSDDLFGIEVSDNTVYLLA